MWAYTSNFAGFGNFLDPEILDSTMNKLLTRFPGVLVESGKELELTTR
jgi:hypothetical protein